MSYEHRQEKEAILTQEIDDLIAQANASDAEEDAIYLDKRGDELPSVLQFKQQRLKTVRAAKEALEARELAPGQTIDDFDAKAQISFADKEARIMGSSGQFDYSYNSQHVLIVSIKSLLVNMSVNALMTSKKLNPLGGLSKIAQIKLLIK